MVEFFAGVLGRNEVIVTIIFSFAFSLLSTHESASW